MSTAPNNANKPPDYSETGKYSEAAYIQAMKRHENEIGNAQIGKRNAQRFACVMSFIAVMSLGLNFYQVSLPAYMPVIVQTDNYTGAVIGSPIMMENSRQPNDKEVQYFIWQVIQKTRQIPLDPVMYKTNWDNAYKFLTSGAASKLANYSSTEGQKDLLDQGFASVAELRSYSALPGQDNTYQVRWQETFFAPDGKVASKTMMTGFFVVEFAEITDPLINPFGIEIKDCNITKEA